MTSSPRTREHRKAAARAGLTYVTDGIAGITRRRSGSGWTYFAPNGARIRDRTLLRVGNDEYARETRSFGLTTLRRRHVAVSGPSLRFSFRGKSGVEHNVALTDQRLARIVQRCRDLPGTELFQYLDAFG